MGNVAIYSRVSTQQQTTDRQLEELTKIANEKGYSIDDNHVYVDIISGFKKGEIRPSFSKMIQDIEKGEINIILISEFSRLARNATDLLQQINYFKEHNVTVYFHKQNITVNNDNSNIGNTILLHVLAVMSSYEIELFAERSLGGKIIKVQNGGADTDSRAYGYTSVEKKIVINNDEAKVVQQIFEQYNQGYSVIDIAYNLNANKVPSPYSNRVKAFIENRKRNGLELKEYKFDVNNLKWRANTISRILANKLYIGQRHISYHKPDPTNILPTKQRKDRQKIYEYNEQCENLRIISDELFQAVQDRLSRAKYNRNNAIKHDNLLKSKLRCGECGGNFSVGNSFANSSFQNNKRTYKCYGIISRKDKLRTCKDGSEIRQARLDGLVVTYSLKIFAQISIETVSKERILELNKDIEMLNSILTLKLKDRQCIDDNYKKAMKRLILVDNSVVEQLITETTNKYNTDISNINNSIEKLNKELINKKITISKLSKISGTYSGLKSEMDKIRNNKELIKEMIEEYIDVIHVYRIHSIWNLIIIKYKNNLEIWGTIKAARYKKDEMFYDCFVCRYGIEFKSWCIVNSEHCFSYNKLKHTIVYDGHSSNEQYKNIKAGEYTYEEFNDILINTDNLNSYSLYYYENLRSEE